MDGGHRRINEGGTVLHGPITHPPLVGALAAAGHGSRVLVADANYPHSTGANPRAERVFLNLRPGLVTVDDVLEVLVAAVPLEAATVMVPAGGEPVPAHAGFEAILGDLDWQAVGRFEFYELCKSDAVALVIATGEQRLYANVLLTVGVRTG